MVVAILGLKVARPVPLLVVLSLRNMVLCSPWVCNRLVEVVEVVPRRCRSQLAGRRPSHVLLWSLSGRHWLWSQAAICCAAFCGVGSQPPRSDRRPLRFIGENNQRSSHGQRTSECLVVHWRDESLMLCTQRHVVRYPFSDVLSFIGRWKSNRKTSMIWLVGFVDGSCRARLLETRSRSVLICWQAADIQQNTGSTIPGRGHI